MECGKVKKEKLKIELHIHTRFSHDSMMALWLLYIKCRICKIDVVAITDHNTIQGASKFKRLYDVSSLSKISFVKGVHVIVGSEILTNQGEIIGLFLNKEINKNMSPIETVNEIKKQGGLVYLPHPYDKKRKKTVLTEVALEQVYKYIDCAECYNGRNVEKYYSTKQEEICNKYKLKKVIGSDAHTIIEIGRNYMITDCEAYDKNKFLQAITDAEVKRANCIYLAHTITKYSRIIKMILGGKWIEIGRIVNERIKRKKLRISEKNQ